MGADNFLQKRQKQQKQRGRPFEKGHSGNPKGRPRGCRNRSNRAAQLLLQGEAEALICCRADQAAERRGCVRLRRIAEGVLDRWRAPAPALR